MEFRIVNGTLTRYLGRGGIVTIPDGVRQIGPRAFMGCEGLFSVRFPEGVTSVGPMAFYDCVNLQQLETAGEPSGNR